MADGGLNPVARMLQSDQRLGKEVNWIIETKGRVWEGTRAKDEAITSWCRRISEEADSHWRYVRINQKDVNLSKVTSLADLVYDSPQLLTTSVLFGRG